MSLHHRVFLQAPEHVPHVTVSQRSVSGVAVQIEVSTQDFGLEWVQFRGKLVVAFAGDEIAEVYVVVEEDVSDGVLV